MNKMQMAHDFAMNCLKNPSYADAKTYNIISSAWTYADAMQAEADKREDKAIPDAILNNEKRQQEQTNYHDALVEVGLEEWQPDWSQAPGWANWWYKTSDNKYQWCSRKPYQDGCNWFVNCSDIYTLDVSPSFNYQGSWQDSLRKRPK